MLGPAHWAVWHWLLPLGLRRQCGRCGVQGCLLRGSVALSLEVSSWPQSARHPGLRACRATAVSSAGSGAHSFGCGLFRSFTGPLWLQWSEAWPRMEEVEREEAGFEVGPGVSAEGTRGCEGAGVQGEESGRAPWCVVPAAGGVGACAAY